MLKRNVNYKAFVLIQFYYYLSNGMQRTFVRHFYLKKIKKNVKMKKKKVPTNDVGDCPIQKLRRVNFGYENIISNFLYSYNIGEKTKLINVKKARSHNLGFHLCFICEGLRLGPPPFKFAFNPSST